MTPSPIAASVVLNHSRWPRSSISAALRSRSARRTAPIVVQANSASTRMLATAKMASVAALS